MGKISVRFTPEEMSVILQKVVEMLCDKGLCLTGTSGKEPQPEDCVSEVVDFLSDVKARLQVMRRLATLDEERKAKDGVIRKLNEQCARVEGLNAMLQADLNGLTDKGCLVGKGTFAWAMGQLSTGMAVRRAAWPPNLSIAKAKPGAMIYGVDLKSKEYPGYVVNTGGMVVAPPRSGFSRQDVETADWEVVE